jgi:hypothetical protein
MKLREPDYSRLRELYVELEFHTLVKTTVAPSPEPESKTAKSTTIYKNGRYDRWSQECRRHCAKGWANLDRHRDINRPR